MMSPSCIKGGQGVVEVQVGSAYRGGGHLDDGIRGFLQDGVRDLVHPDVATAVSDDGFHRRSFLWRSGPLRSGKRGGPFRPSLTQGATPGGRRQTAGRLLAGQHRLGLHDRGEKPQGGGGDGGWMDVTGLYALDTDEGPPTGEGETYD